MLVSQRRIVRHVKTLFVSDVHLGAVHAQSEAFSDYLEGVEPESLYIVGDFIDGWKLKSGFHWQPVCSTILTQLSKMLGRGSRIYYTPGNHDSFLRSDSFVSSLGGQFAGIEIADEFLFDSIAGQRLLVTHGDLFDSVECGAQWLSKLSSSLYDPLLSINALASRACGVSDRSPYAFCARVKKKVKQGVRFISGFEERVLTHAKSQRCSGAICGHIHAPAIVQRDDMTYFNTGDWVENCTALIEYHDGRIDLDYYYGRDEPAPARSEALIDATEAIADPISTSRSEELQEPCCIAWNSRRHEQIGVQNQ